ncbi:uncharacterized protein LOC110238782 [Exaiptasia diaphana]|uniref:Uncharacterized protein n=1 Tax=Exaiptasia diaphana TaxID=2652724 RepID=A0A913X7K0_EXADI|nr:uncharacterized protein LOC110238782 [Exaiptasia diaphana]
MKDKIAEIDVQKALIKQLKEKDSFSVIKKKKKNTEASFKLKKRKSLDEKDDSMTLDKPDVPKKKHKDNKQDNSVQRPLRPPPKVVEFEERGKSKQENRQKDKVSNEKDNDDISYDDFMEIARDVKEFGFQ